MPLLAIPYVPNMAEYLVLRNRRILDTLFAELGLVPRVVAETNGFTASMVMATNGMAATVVPELLVQSLGGGAGTVALPLVDPELEKEVALVSARRDPGLPAVEALRRLLALS